MRVPMSWLRDYVDVPSTESARDVATRLIRAGLEVETVDEAGADVEGPLVVGRVVVGRVVEFTEETHKNGKTIRWCQVDVGPEHNSPGSPSDAKASDSDVSAAGHEGKPRGIVCGALNFANGDLVVVSLPGAVLPGGFTITARKTYGHVSDGMICSARELGLGDDHTGIIVLRPGEAEVGDDAASLLHLRDDVLDIAVTPDRGYAMSIRGVAREVATAYGVPYRDPAHVDVEHAGDGYPVRIEDADRCPVFAARAVTGFDSDAKTPRWMQRRIQLAGMRPLSLAIDITNYVMLELGEPIHGYDRTLLSGPIVVRRANAGEKLTTLDDTVRDLDPDDLLITDDSGPIGLAGVMGGATTELGPSTTEVVIEAANFEATGVARTARRHKLPTEGAKRWERGVDPALPAVAAQRVADLMAELGGATIEPGGTLVGAAPEPPKITIDAELPSRVVGVDYAHDEVARLHGYDAVPSKLPVAPAGRGITFEQRLRRRVERAVAAAGYVEAPSYPFVGTAELDALGLPDDDARRQLVRLANPLSDEQPYLRSTLLPGLLATLRRNVRRGFADAALFEAGLVFRPGPKPLPEAPRLPVDRRPTDEEIAALEAALPAQPRRIAVAACGNWEPPGWWGDARPVSWADSVAAARLVAEEAGVALTVVRDDHAPWHPGRCAALYVGSTLVGHAGELHPRVVAALGLPERTVAMELELDRLGAREGPVRATPVTTYPIATQDVALVVPSSVPASDVEAALRDGAGDLLESIRLFDVYEGAQVGEGQRSLAYALRFRAPDRTLTVEETTDIRDAAVAEAARRTGAVLRG